MVCLSNGLICVYDALSWKVSEKTLRMHISFHSLLFLARYGLLRSKWLISAWLSIQTEQQRPDAPTPVSASAQRSWSHTWLTEGTLKFGNLKVSMGKDHREVPLDCTSPQLVKYSFPQRQVVTFNLCTTVSGCVWVICSIASSHLRNEWDKWDRLIPYKCNFPIHVYRFSTRVYGFSPRLDTCCREF